MDCNVFWHRGFSRRNSDSISLYLWVFRKPHDVTSSTLRVYSVSVVGPWLGTRSWSFSRSLWGPSQVPGSLLWSVLSTVASRSFETLHKLNLGSAQHLVSCPWPTAEALLQGLSKGSPGLSVTQVPAASLPTSPLRPRHSAAAAPQASFVSWMSRVGCLLGLSLFTLPGLLFLCMTVTISSGLSLFTLPGLLFLAVTVAVSSGLSLFTLLGLLFLCMSVTISSGLSLFTLWTALPVCDCGLTPHLCCALCPEHHI